MKNKIIPYNPKLKEYARQLRKNSTLSEILLWKNVKQRALGVQFHRQVPLLEYIVDFYCHELQLAIEIDGGSHDYKYEYDSKRQGLLEKQGVQFIRFSDKEVKKDMISVGLALEEKVDELLKISKKFKNNPKVTHSSPTYDRSSDARREQYPKEPSRKTEPKLKADNSFPKKEKLKSRKLIEQLFDEGKSISKYPVKLIYLKTRLPEEVVIRVGVAVPKKNFKGAVKRNRIKRLLREAYRLNKHLIFNNTQGNFAFLFLYLGKEMPDFFELERCMKEILGKFLKAEEKI